MSRRPKESPTPDVDRPHRLNMTLSDKERAIAFELAFWNEMNVSDYIRTLLYREHEKLSAKKGRGR